MLLSFYEFRFTLGEITPSTKFLTVSFVLTEITLVNWCWLQQLSKLNEIVCFQCSPLAISAS